MMQTISSGKEDTEIYLDNSILGAVLSVSVKTERERRPLYEMLNREPWYYKAGKCAYIISIKQLSDRRFEFPESFNLTFKTGAEAVSYENCVVERSESFYDDSRRIVTATKIISYHKELTK